MSDPRRRIPSVDALLADAAFFELSDRYGRERVREELRASIDRVRALLAEGGSWSELDSPRAWAGDVQAALARADVPSLRPVINATGVVLHTNLGRAPLAESALSAMADTARGYANLEYDLEAGTRGSRYDHCAALLAELTGAEAALVVNNAAAGLLLALNTLARGERVLVSRGELIEIGGGFRIPEILERSGARLVEVGSTNRTRLGDYEAEVDGAGAAALLKVHRSNFSMSGFTEEASLAELAGLARRSGIPLVHDLGSGLFVRADLLGLPDEPRAHDSLAAGADLVVVSGDKLFGGPQAGLVLGGAARVAALRANPLCRALRVDKVTLAGLEATARLYRDPGRAVAEIPTLRMLAAAPEELEAAARALSVRLHTAGVEGAEAVAVEGRVGGGTYPGLSLRSWAVSLAPRSGPDAFAAALRAGDPPSVARIEGDRVLLDVRTVAARETDALVGVVAAAWRAGGG